MLLPNQDPLRRDLPPQQDCNPQSEPLYLLREFQARSLAIEEATETQFLKICAQLNVPLPDSALRALYEAIERGESPILPAILYDFCPEAAASIASACGWHITTDGKLRPFVECVITLLEGEDDLRNVEVVLRRGVREGELLLEIRYDERLLAEQYRCPDRWALFEGILESVELTLPRYGNRHRADTAFIDITSSTRIALLGLEQDRPRFMRDEHLALRPELLPSILRTDENSSLQLRIDCLRSQILGDCAMRKCDTIHCRSDIAKHREEIDSALKTCSLVLLVYEDLVVPVTRAVSRETLHADLQKLISIRDRLSQCPDPIAVTRPVQVSVHSVDADRINFVLSLAGYQLPQQLVESIVNYLRHNDSILEVLVEPLLPRGTEIILRSESAVQVSKIESPIQSRTFSIESPGNSRVGIFGMSSQSKVAAPQDSVPAIEEFGGSGEPVDPEGLSPAEEFRQPGELEPSFPNEIEDTQSENELEDNDSDDTEFESVNEDEERDEGNSEIGPEPYSSGSITRLDDKIAIDALTIAIQWPAPNTSSLQSGAIQRWGVIEEICRQLGMERVPRALATPVAADSTTNDILWRVAVTKRLIPELALREQ